MKNSCLVLEGGGLRGAFTSGVLEYFLERNLNFDRVIGVSAGACIGASFLSKQQGRNRKVNVENPSPEYSIGRTEKRLDLRLRLYHHGYQLAGEVFEEIKLFLDGTVAHPLTDHLK